MINDSEKRRTDKFNSGFLSNLDLVEAEISYRPVPQNIDIDSAGSRPVWRIRLDLASDPTRRLGLDINGEVILGRNIDAPNLVDLTDLGGSEFGVSRQHVLLRPTTNDLLVVDLGSTNGTFCNNQQLDVNDTYALSSGDTLTLGRLQFVVHIIRRPGVQTALLAASLNLEDALMKIARAITSKLDLDEVLNQIAEMAMTLTSAGETGIWLVDELTGELFLEAERGITDERVRRMRLPIRRDTLVGKVIRTGKPARARRAPGEDQIKVKTNYLVEALVYVPIKLGQETLGVLAAVHRVAGNQFEKRDEQLLSAIADSAAIAIQNARLYEATDQALQERVEELSALNEVSRTVSSLIDLDSVYTVLAEQVNKYWPVEAVRLYLLNENEKLLYPLSAQEGAEAVRPYPIGMGIIGQVAQTGQAIMTNAAAEHARYNDAIDGLNEHETQSIACVPLRSNRVVGVLALLNKTDADFTDEDLYRLQAFANPIATAVENARLFAEANRQRAAIQATAQALPQPLIILDERGEILISNKAAQEILDSHMAKLFEAFSNGVGLTKEILIGEKTYLTTTEHEPDLGTIIVMQDITYVKKLEEERSDFMHALSHDLKSPLTSITGWAQLLEKVQPLDDKGARYVNRILAAGDRMLDMIEQLLHTVDQRDAVEIVQEPCNLITLVDRIKNDVQGAALNKSITVAVQVQGEPYQIVADTNRMYHMILNLVDNAIKYSPAKTQVDICLEFRATGIVILVQDDGPGIPKDDLDFVFDKYYRGKQKDLAPGAGLGLSVVKTIAEAHGGQVAVANLPERGAEFMITLPGSLRLVAE
ncbi:MAG: GAF domain-containing protein [Ardenticatenaceae bacterium]|nr:GAF domain-containing protein [Ardenticatenaceae bacterium]MCB9442993.1 GAF domain-containing protein [Ardenticatenaceae bacterium]